MLSARRKYFSDVILPLHGRMYAAALAVVGSEEDAADVVQTAMLQVWEVVSKGTELQYPQAYCIRTVRNIALTEVSRHKINQSGEDEALRIASAEYADSGVKVSDTMSLLESLSERERQAVKLTAFAGCSSDEVADTLGVSVENARKILCRARKHLRALLEK